MSQENNVNKQNSRKEGGDQKNRPNPNSKRHYRDIGDAGSSNQDKQQGERNSDSQQSQNSAGQQQKRQGGNQPPRNRRPRNRRPAQNSQGGPVERKEAQPNRNNRNRQKPQSAEMKAKTKDNANAPKLNASADKASDQEKKQNRQPRQTRTRSKAENRNNRWEKRVRQEETADDIRRDIERIEKEIWLEIAGIHTIKLDF